MSARSGIERNFEAFQKKLSDLLVGYLWRLIKAISYVVVGTIATVVILVIGIIVFVTMITFRQW